MADPCWICNRDATEVVAQRGPLEITPVHNCHCAGCGKYVVAFDFAQDILEAGRLKPDERLLLSAAIRRANDISPRLGMTDPITHDNYKTIAASRSMPDALEQADLFIAEIANRSSFATKTPLEPLGTWAARLFFGPLVLVQELDDALASHGLTTNRTMNADGSGLSAAFRLTLRGWERARELRRVRGAGNQAFVAMWFHPELDIVYEQGFKPALEATGYRPYKVNDAHHTNRIDDEIHAEIRRSKILIADATGLRPSVYYEAGLARGLGLDVLWCCNDSYRAHALDGIAPNMLEPPCVTNLATWFSGAAFDTNHEVFILWKDPPDLCAKLVARIRGLGRDLLLAR